MVELNFLPQQDFNDFVRFLGLADWLSMFMRSNRAVEFATMAPLIEMNLTNGSPTLSQDNSSMQSMRVDVVACADIFQYKSFENWLINTFKFTPKQFRMGNLQCEHMTNFHTTTGSFCHIIHIFFCQTKL